MQNKPGDALVFLENSVVDDPGHVLAHMYLGIVYEQLNRTEEAIAIYRRILPRAGSLTANVANNLANVYFSRGNTEYAEQFFTQAVEFDPLYSSAWLGRANTRVRAGSFREAVNDYEHYLSLEPASVQRPTIEQMVSALRTEIAAEERRRLIAEEEERIRAEQRQRLLDEISASLQAAADSSLGISTGTEDVEGYATEFVLE